MEGYPVDRRQHRSIGAVIRGAQGYQNERKDEKEKICSVDSRYFDDNRRPVCMR